MSALTLFSLYMGRQIPHRDPDTIFSLGTLFFIILLLLWIISLLYEEAKNTVLACLLLFLLVSTNGIITGHCHNPSTV